MSKLTIDFGVNGLTQEEAETTIQTAIEWYANDLAECIKCGVDDEEEWERRKESAESIGVIFTEDYPE